MPQIPDLTDPRYRDEVGWFLYHARYGREKSGGSYDDERIAYSRLLLEEVLTFLHREPEWLWDKTVVSIGWGCTGDLATFPAAIKIALDPLLYVYQKLGSLLVICRNALDHMPKPGLVQSLRALVERHFDFDVLADTFPLHSEGQACSTQLVARKKPGIDSLLDPANILRAYATHMHEAKFA